jgi:hypothetical protein
MRKTTTTLLAPLAALAVAGTIGAGPAQAHGDEHGQYGGEQSDSSAAEIVTSEEATAVLDEAGVTTEAVEPATAEEQEDGLTELSFPKDEESEKKYDNEVEFLGGVEYASEAGSTTWQEPAVDTSDGLVSFDVAGERTDLLQVVPAEDSEDSEESGESDESGEADESDESDDHGEARTASYGGETEGHDGEESGEHGDKDEYDLALTAEGADALNEVAGDDTFAEGDIFASTDDGKDC